MKKYLNKYNDIIARYRKGEFGNESLSLYDILKKADHQDLFDKMSLSEIQDLIDSSFGITKMLFAHIKQEETNKIQALNMFEKELEEFDIDSYRDKKDTSDKALAHNLNLLVKCCGMDEMPEDTEAMLCPIEDENYFGIIKIREDFAKSKFSFRHELMHYFKDVGVGNRVTHAVARNIKGKTPNKREQDINYFTAASIMPIKEIVPKLEDFEKLTSKETEKSFLFTLAQQYEQDEDAVLRRLIEVRRLVDFSNIM